MAVVVAVWLLILTPLGAFWCDATTCSKNPLGLQGYWSGVDSGEMNERGEYPHPTATIFIKNADTHEMISTLRCSLKKAEGIWTCGME